MTEAEVLADIVERGNQLGENIQFWISVSFGVLVAAHLTKGQVNLLVIGVALIFYSGFTWIISGTLIFEVNMLRAAVSTLVEMARDGQTLSPISEEVIQRGPVATASAIEFAARRAILFGMYLLTCAYPVYCYYTSRPGND